VTDSKDTAPLGHALHHCVARIRGGRDAGNGADARTCIEAWSQAHPVLLFNAFENHWPARACAYTAPEGRHVQVGALRAAPAAVRKAQVPAGQWRGREALRPAEQVLHALEALLAAEIRP
jgi:hypothetical protein